MDTLAYSIAALSEATGVSEDVIRRAIKAGDLVASYPSSRPVITRSEAERWLASLPTERRAS